MYKVLLYNHPDWWLKQTKHSQALSADGRFKFYTNANQIEDPDFVVIRNNILKKPQTFHVPAHRIMLITSEPESVIHFSKAYCKQFAAVATSQNIDHHHVMTTPPLIPWHAGTDSINGKMCIKWGYDEFKTLAHPEKTKLISVVTSNKSFTKGHRERIYFVEKLKQHFGNKIDIFGREFNDFKDKYDVIAPYKYHIVIENSTSPDYWTEKLKDSYLGGSFPIYHGCRNIGDYFPINAFAQIDISKIDQAINTIEETIAQDLYEKNIGTLMECKDLVLDRYNMFNLMAEACSKLLEQTGENNDRSMVTIYPLGSFGDFVNKYHHLIAWPLSNAKYKFHRIFHEGL